ncbi:MAG: hypothetical protein EBS01_09125, partial [Verrucomicrobia bacterium]|nr:hypothetical protein [Verrucomicrobiota bacterium]
MNSSGSLIKTSSGLLTLSGNNGYTGTTSVDAGTLTLTGSLASTVLSVVSGATLNAMFGSSLSTATQLTVNGAANLFNPAVTLDALLGGGTVTLNTTALTLGSGAFSGVIRNGASTGSLTKVGDGTLELSGANTYSGGTTLQAGVLLLNGNDRLLPAGSITLSGGTLDLGGNAQTAGLISLNSGLIRNGSLTSTTGFNVMSGDVDAILSGTVALMKSGPGTLTLRLSNDYSGGTTLAGGLLTISASERLLDEGFLTIDGGTFDLGGFTETVGLLTFRSGSIVNGTLIATGFNVEYGVVSSSFTGTGRMIKTTDGLAVLTGQSNYTGGTQINAGTLRLGGNDRLPVAGEILLNAGLFDLGGFTQNSGTLTLATGEVSNGTLLSSAYVLRSGTVSAVLSGTGALTKTTAGTALLTGANNYSGATSIGVSDGVAAGVLRLAGAGSLSNAALRIYAGTLDLNGTTQTVAAVTLGGGTMLSGASILLGGGSLMLGGPVTFDSSNQPAGASIRNGLVDLGGTRVFDVGSSLHGAPDLIVDAVLANGGLAKTGLGTLRLDQSNLFTGLTQVDAGTLLLNGDDRLWNGGSLVITGGALDLGGNTQNTTGLVVFNGGIVRNGTYRATGQNFDAQQGAVSATLAGSAGLTKSGTSVLTLSGVNAYSGLTLVTAGSLVLSGGNDRLWNGGSLTITGGVLDLGGNTQNTTGLVVFNGGTVQNGTYGVSVQDFDAQQGVVSATLSGAVGLIKSGVSTLTLSGMNAYTGLTLVSAGSLILSGGDDRLWSGGSLTISGGVLDLGGNTQSTTGLVVFNGGTVQTGTYSATGQNFDARQGFVSATLSGVVGLTKSGASTLTLSGSNTYTGLTVVGDGSLILSGGNDRLWNGGSLTINGGVLDLGGNTQNTTGLVVLNGGIVQNGTYSATGQNFDAQQGFVSATLAGSAGLTKSTAGTLTLNGSNTYTGATTVNLGTLTLGVNNALALGSSVTVNAGELAIGTTTQAVNAVTLNGGLLSGTTGTLTGTSYTVEAGTISAVLAGSGVSLSKNTVGGVLLSAANTYTGATTVNLGTLTLGV